MIYQISYILIPIFALITNKIYGNNTEKSKLRFLFLSFLMLCLISGLRGISVGSDTIAYANIYNTVSFCSFEQLRIHPSLITIEYPYLIFMKFFTLITINPQLYLFVTSIIINIGIASFIYYNSENVFTSTLIYFALLFFESMSITRQYMAISISFQALHLIRKRKFKSAILCLLITFFVHKSVIVFWFIFIIYFFRKKALFIYCIFGGLIFILLIFRLNLLDFFIMQTPYSHYVDSKYMQKSYLGGTIDIVYLTITILSFFLFIIRKSTVKKLNLKDCFFCDDSLFWIAMMFINSTFLYIAMDYMVVMRVAMYFGTFVILMIPSVFKYLGRYKILAEIMLFLSLFIVIIYSAPLYKYEFLCKV